MAECPLSVEKGRLPSNSLAPRLNGLLSPSPPYRSRAAGPSPCIVHRGYSVSAEVPSSFAAEDERSVSDEFTELGLPPTEKNKSLYVNGK